MDAPTSSEQSFAFAPVVSAVAFVYPAASRQCTVKAVELLAVQRLSFDEVPHPRHRKTDLQHSPPLIANYPRVPLLAKNPGELRTGPAHALPQIIAQLGGSPRQVFRNARLDLDQFINDGEHCLDYQDIARLFNTAAQHTHCGHIGLLVGRRFILEDLGPVGQLMRFAETVHEALHDLTAHTQLHDRGGTPLLLPLSGQFSLLGYVIHRHDLTNPARVIDCVIMIGLQVLRELLGPGWAPIRVQLAYRQPTNAAYHEQAFRCPVQFDAPVSGLVINNQHLHRRQASAAPHMHQLLQRAITSTTASLTISEQVRRLLYPLLFEGKARTGDIATQVALHERTLRRRLEVEGTHLQQLISESRRNLALQLLRHTILPISAIAQTLQYRDPNAFSRAFRAWMGTSPQSWRNSDRK
ncbi:AraC family transcriptional regulator [Pseudomonas sp. NPDC077186]|uniref:AraC family transcriptional regulator n=1 Tax=Pseudomonas sp. NPDC077186 TaxID=3364421 RepID=UPI0037C4F3F0